MHMESRLGDSWVGMECQVSKTGYTRSLDAIHKLTICPWKIMLNSLSLFVPLNGHQCQCQAGSTQIFITVPWEDAEEALLNLTACMSCFTLNLLTLLTVTTNIPLGLPVTEAQLGRVALAETAACNSLGPSLSSLTSSPWFSQLHLHWTKGGSRVQHGTCQSSCFCVFALGSSHSLCSFLLIKSRNQARNLNANWGDHVRPDLLRARFTLSLSHVDLIIYHSLKTVSCQSNIWERSAMRWVTIWFRV